MIQREIYNLIYKIKAEIAYKKLDVVSLCEGMGITEEELYEYLTKPQQKISLYIEILEEVRNDN